MASGITVQNLKIEKIMMSKPDQVFGDVDFPKGITIQKYSKEQKNGDMYFLTIDSIEEILELLFGLTILPKETYENLRKIGKKLDVLKENFKKIENFNKSLQATLRKVNKKTVF